MNALERLVNEFRISPHGITLLAIGSILTIDRILGLGIYENLPLGLQIFDSSLGGACLGSGIFYTSYCSRNYREFKEEIQENGLQKEMVERELKTYCKRQAYKAAAYATGNGKEFDEINHAYPKEKKYFKWMPEV